MRANGLQESGLWVGGGSTSAADRVQGRDIALGEETQALGFRTRGRKAGGKPLEALFPPAVKGRLQKRIVRTPIITTIQASPSVLVL